MYKPKECKVCEKQHNNRVYCSIRCSNIDRAGRSKRRTIDRMCAYCRRNEITTRGAKYCSQSCAGEYANRQRVEGWLSGTDLYTSPYAIPSFIRNFLMAEADNKCVECGWSKVHSVTGRVPLQVDHIDGDCTNNLRENLRVLCPNCHSLTINYGSLNKGRSTRKYRYNND